MFLYCIQPDCQRSARLPADIIGMPTSAAGLETCPTAGRKSASLLPDKLETLKRAKQEGCIPLKPVAQPEFCYHSLQRVFNTCITSARIWQVLLSTGRTIPEPSNSTLKRAKQEGRIPLGSVADPSFVTIPYTGSIGTLPSLPRLWQLPVFAGRAIPTALNFATSPR